MRCWLVENICFKIRRISLMFISLTAFFNALLISKKYFTRLSGVYLQPYLSSISFSHKILCFQLYIISQNEVFRLWAWETDIMMDRWPTFQRIRARAVYKWARRWSMLRKLHHRWLHRSCQKPERGWGAGFCFITPLKLFLPWSPTTFWWPWLWGPFILFLLAAFNTVGLSLLIEIPIAVSNSWSWPPSFCPYSTHSSPSS